MKYSPMAEIDFFRKHTGLQVLFLHLHMKGTDLFHLLRAPANGNHYPDFFFRKGLLNCLNCRDEIGVTRDKNGSVIAILKCKIHEIDGNIDIGHLLFIGLIFTMTQATGFIDLFEHPIDNLYTAGPQCLEEDLMPLHFSGVPTGEGSEVIDILDGILPGNIALGQPREIEPFVAMQPFIVVQCMVEVESVDEKRRSPHSIRKPGATGLPGPPAHEVLTG